MGWGVGWGLGGGEVVMGGAAVLGWIIVMGLLHYDSGRGNPPPTHSLLSLFSLWTLPGQLEVLLERLVSVFQMYAYPAF